MGQRSRYAALKGARIKPDVVEYAGGWNIVCNPKEKCELRDREEECALDMEQRSSGTNQAKQEGLCLKSMSQQSQERNVAEKDAQMSSYKEEYV
eukprot:scaffold3239_cov160-Skeletonema_menzelii.AAC.3